MHRGLSVAAVRGKQFCKGLACVLFPFVLVTCALLDISPGAEFSATPTSGTAPLVVYFDALASYSMISGSLLYQWDFGDGSPPTPPSEGIEAMMLSHAYQEPGTYHATLRVIDSNNMQDTCTQTITVTGPRGSVGSTINNGYVSVELIGVRTASLVCDLAPPPEMIYVIVNVRVGAVAGRISCGLFQLMDASGQTRYQSFLSIGACLDDSFVCGFISTGEQESGEILFEVPPSSSYTLIYDGEWCEQPITFGFQI